jgi:hypothetical protein
MVPIFSWRFKHLKQLGSMTYSDTAGQPVDFDGSLLNDDESFKSPISVLYLLRRANSAMATQKLRPLGSSMCSLLTRTSQLNLQWIFLQG